MTPHLYSEIGRLAEIIDSTNDSAVSDRLGAQPHEEESSDSKTDSDARDSLAKRPQQEEKDTDSKTDRAVRDKLGALTQCLQDEEGIKELLPEIRARAKGIRAKNYAKEDSYELAVYGKQLGSLRTGSPLTWTASAVTPSEDQQPGRDILLAINKQKNKTIKMALRSFVQGKESLQQAFR